MKQILIILFLLLLITACSGGSLDTYPFEIIQIDKGYSGAEYSVLVNNKLAYRVLNFDNTQQFIYDGQVFGEKYARVNTGSALNFSDGTIAFMARTSEGRFTIVSDKDKISLEHDDIFAMSNFNDKLLYRALDNGQYYVVYDGEIVAKGYDAYNEFVKKHKRNESKKVYVQYDENITQGYSPIYSFVQIGEKAAFVTGKLNNQFLVYDGIEIGKGKYADVDNILNYNGKLVFSAKLKNDKSHVYMINE